MAIKHFSFVVVFVFLLFGSSRQQQQQPTTTTGKELRHIRKQKDEGHTRYSLYIYITIVKGVLGTTRCGLVVARIYI